MPHCFHSLALLTALGLPLAAQEPRLLLEAGDSIGAAHLVSLELRSASRPEAWPDSATVVYAAETDAPAATSLFLLATTYRDSLGSLTTATLLREGDPEPGDPTRPLRAFPDADATSLGQGSLIEILTSGADPFATTQLYWNSVPLARNGDALALPGNTGPNRLLHVHFRHARANDTRRLLVAGDIWPRLVDTVPPWPALLRYQLDANGMVASAELVLDARGNLTFFPTPYDALPQDGRASDLDENGGWITRARGVDGLWRVVRDGVDIAVEGGASPVVGRTWSALGGDQPVALGPRGGYAFVGGLSGDAASARIVLQDGAVLVQQGETLAGTTSAITPRADTRLAYGGDGRVLWIGDLAGGGQALVRGREVLLVSFALVASRPLLALEDFVATSDGRFVFVDAVLATGNALLRLDLGAAELVTPCLTPNAGFLRRTAGTVAVGASFELTLDAPVPPGSLATLRLASFGGSCEASFPFGEVYFDAGSTVGRFVVGLTAGAPLTRVIAVPNDLGLLGVEGFCQAAFLTPAGTSARIVLTNGLRLEVGAP